MAESSSSALPSGGVQTAGNGNGKPASVVVDGVAEGMGGRRPCQTARNSTAATAAAADFSHNGIRMWRRWLSGSAVFTAFTARAAR